MKAAVFIILVNTLYWQKKKNGKNKSKRKEGFITRIRGELHAPGVGTEQGLRKYWSQDSVGRKAVFHLSSLPHSLTNNGYD